MGWTMEEGRREELIRRNQTRIGVCAPQVGLDIPLERTLDPSTVTGVELARHGTHD